MSDPDYFETLGVPRRFHLDLAALEQRFHERSRQHHPDRHARAEPTARVKSALATTQLTMAYRTLKAAIPRAEYLLKLEGLAIGDERGAHKAPQAFLVEIMELREALMEARMEGDAARVRALAGDVRARQKGALAAIDAAFTTYESGDRAGLAAAADALIAERYFRRFLDEVEAFEEKLADA